MKILFILISFSTISYAQKLTNTPNEIDNLLDELKYSTVLPDENFYPKGDTIYAKILNKGKKITPYLIKRIDDSTSTSFKYVDHFTYTIGDFATSIIDYQYNDSEFPIRKLLEEEFFKNENNKDLQFDILYHQIFFTNSETINYKNRKRFKRIIQEWFKDN